MTKATANSSFPVYYVANFQLALELYLRNPPYPLFHLCHVGAITLAVTNVS